MFRSVHPVVNVERHDNKAPTAFSLEQNFPNPFNGFSIFGFRIAESGLVRLAVYDLLGREVAVLVNEWKTRGSYRVTFDAKGMASGIYFYRLTAGDFAQSRKLVLLK